MTTEPQWTPGPWEADGPDVYGANGRVMVASCDDPLSALSWEEQIANAHLIAAAPALATGVSEVIDFLTSYFGPVEDEDSRARWSDTDAFDVWCKLRAALALALGEMK